MNLLCIVHDCPLGPPEAGYIIVFGQVYEAIGEYVKYDHKYYELAIDPGVGYAEECFVVLPDDTEIEATELDAEFAAIVHEVENA